MSLELSSFKGFYAPAKAGFTWAPSSYESCNISCPSSFYIASFRPTQFAANSITCDVMPFERKRQFPRVLWRMGLFLTTIGCKNRPSLWTMCSFVFVGDRPWIFLSKQYYLITGDEGGNNEPPRSSTLDVLLSTTYSRSQMYLCRQLAQLHPELTMPMFSGKKLNDLCSRSRGTLNLIR